MTEPDPMLRRIERGSFVACIAIALIAWPIGRWQVTVPLGVFAGGALVAISYRGIKSGIDALVTAMTAGGSGHGNAAWALVKFFTRYAILAAAAYVIMARLRLPPVAVFAGASSFVAAVAFEALGQLRRGR
jgi:hypothetical protein